MRQSVSMLTMEIITTTEVGGGKGNSSVSPEKHNGSLSLQIDEFQMSKRFARQALKDKEEVRKKNKEARKTTKKAQKTKEEAQRIKDEAAKKEEEVRKMMENTHIFTKKKADKKHKKILYFKYHVSGGWCSGAGV